MATQIGRGHIFGLSGATTAISVLSGYVSPNMQSLRVSAGADTIRLRGQDGITNAVICSDDVIELTIEFIPQGTAAAPTIADAKKSAGLPAAGSGVTLSGLPVITIAGIADALNSDDWIYEGGGNINGDHDKNWTLTLPIKRYPGITSTSPVTS